MKQIIKENKHKQTYFGSFVKDPVNQLHHQFAQVPKKRRER